MAENKKEFNNDSVKQLGAYKTSKLQELNSEISREKTRAAVLLTAIKAKRENLIAAALEEERNKFPTNEAVNTDSVISTVVETVRAAESDNEKVPVKATETVSDEIKTELPVQEKTEKKTETIKKQDAKETVVKNTDDSSIPCGDASKDAGTADNVSTKQEVALQDVKKDVKKADVISANSETESAKGGTKRPEKPEKREQKEVRRSTENSNIQEEVLPNGEIRRIYVPPVAAAKPKVQTRVFGQNGYQGNRPPRPNNQGGPGGYQGGARPPYNRDDNGMSRPPRGGMGGFDKSAPPAMPFPAQKSSPSKGKGPAKGASGGPARFDDKNALNKRALVYKGYVDDQSKADEEGISKVRSYKPTKNRNNSNGGAIIIEHAVITNDPVAIKVLSEKIGKTGAEIIKTLFFLGIIKTINENIDFTTAELVAGEYNITLEYKPDITKEDTLKATQIFDDEDDISKLTERPPVVTIMGHVDHGKTSLLDYIRKSHVTSGEAGGITQHIGAYTVSLKGKPITFLDTPGHEAFTSMRARGAQVTDIAVLVVAADDGIMPQTIEAINHAKQASVPIIVAVNKMDKPTADPDRILQQLSNNDVLPEDWGGDTPVVKVSAKTGSGVDELLENILILSEIKELKANPDRKARGTIVEARLDKGLGKIATILVQNGTLRVGDNVVAGMCTGKIRAMIDDKGKNVRKAGPSVPVSVTGWDEVPEAGDLIDVVADERFARELAEERRIKFAGLDKDTASVSLADLFDKIKKGELKSVKLIIKADVQGSLEAVKQSLSKLGNEEVDIDIIHGGVGAIKESDVTLADTAKAIIIGFNVRPDVNARALAAQKKIDIRFYDIIYNAIEDIENAVKGLLEPKFNEVVLGSAEVREIFKIGGVGSIAGCHVVDGKIIRGAKVRLLRDGKVEYTGEISSLRHGKDDVKEMAKNFDCGIMLQNYNDVKLGDVIEAFQMEKVDEN